MILRTLPWRREAAVLSLFLALSWFAGGAADENKDRSVTAGEMKAYLDREVPYMARRLANVEQNPVVSGDPEAVLVTLGK